MRYGQRSVASEAETVVLTEADGACAALIQDCLLYTSDAADE